VGRRAEDRRAAPPGRIERLVDVRSQDEAALVTLVGSMAGWLRALAHGVDERRVEPHRVTKSSGSERTYTEDLTDLGTIQSEVAKMAEAAARWLEKRDTLARTVTLKVRYKDFRTITRAHSAEPTRDAAAIIDRAVRLVDKTDAGRTPVRLIGVSVSGLGSADDPPPEPPGDPRLPFDT
jgi:DNA polymerase-4